MRAGSPVAVREFETEAAETAGGERCALVERHGGLVRRGSSGAVPKSRVNPFHERSIPHRQWYLIHDVGITHIGAQIFDESALRGRRSSMTNRI
jgi:hypothetical protein